MLEFKIKAIIVDPNKIVANTTIYLFNKRNKILLPIIMTNRAAEKIILARRNELEPRPHVHNTTERIIKALGGKIESIIINKCQGKVFYSYVRIIRNKKEYDVDSKPSDSISIGLRSNAPIFVKENVYKKTGIEITKELLDRSLVD